MQIVTGVVSGGKVVMQGGALPEGTVVAMVAMVAKESESTVRLPAKLLAELEAALDEADREEGIPGDEFLETLKKYG